MTGLPSKRVRAKMKSIPCLTMFASRLASPHSVRMAVCNYILELHVKSVWSSVDTDALAFELGLDGGDVERAEVAVRAEGDGGGDAGALTDHGAAGHVAYGRVGDAVAADAAAGEDQVAARG